MKRYKVFQFRTAVESAAFKVAKSLTLAYKLSIVWTTQTTTAGMNNGGQLYLADVKDDAVLTEADLVKYMGFVVHELCHRAYTDFNAFSYHTVDAYFKAIHNAVEDAFIEHLAIDLKITGNVTVLLSTLIDRMVGEALAHVTDWSAPEQYPFALAVYLRKHAGKKVPLAGGLEPIFAAAAVELETAQNSQDTREIAQRVFDQLKALPKNPKPKPQPKPAKGSQAGQEAPPSDSDKDGEGEGDIEASKPSDVGLGKAPSTTTKAMEVEPEMGSEDPSEPSGTYSKGATLKAPDYHVRKEEWAETAINVPAKLRYSVKRLFDNTGIEEFQRNRKSGSVNVHALTKVSHTDRLFKRRLETDGIDSAVVIALDVSGSMFDDDAFRERIKVAVQATAAMLDTLSRAQVATSVLTFGSSSSILKSWSLPVVKALAKLRCIKDGNSTNDYFAVRYAHEMLLNRAEERKICFVITDGQGNEELTRAQVESGNRLGITTIGIGIKLDVSAVYNQSVTIRNLSDLGNASFKQIKLAA